MALCLGGTIAELQERISLRELQVWGAYHRKHGPMNDVRRFDRPAALLASVVSRVNGGKSEMKDFMPFGQDEKVATLDDIISVFGGVHVSKSR